MWCTKPFGVELSMRKAKKNPPLKRTHEARTHIQPTYIRTCWQHKNEDVLENLQQNVLHLVVNKRVLY